MTSPGTIEFAFSRHHFVLKINDQLNLTWTWNNFIVLLVFVCSWSRINKVFESMFYGEMADKSKVIRIPDLAPIGFENLLRYAYTGMFFFWKGGG